MYQRTPCEAHSPAMRAAGRSLPHASAWLSRRGAMQMGPWRALASAPAWLLQDPESEVVFGCITLRTLSAMPRVLLPATSEATVSAATHAHMLRKLVLSQRKVAEGGPHFHMRPAEKHQSNDIQAATARAMCSCHARASQTTPDCNNPRTSTSAFNCAAYCALVSCPCRCRPACDALLKCLSRRAPESVFQPPSSDVSLSASV